MNSSFACVSILVKSNIPKNCLINFLSEVTSQSLKNYLRLANIYDWICNKKERDLIEMVIYGCLNGKLKNKQIDDISISKSHSILKEKNINHKAFPRHGNLGLRKKDIKPYEENKECSIKLKD